MATRASLPRYLMGHDPIPGEPIGSEATASPRSGPGAEDQGETLGHRDRVASARCPSSTCSCAGVCRTGGVGCSDPGDWLFRPVEARPSTSILNHQSRGDGHRSRRRCGEPRSRCCDCTFPLRHARWLPRAAAARHAALLSRGTLFPDHFNWLDSSAAPCPCPRTKPPCWSSCTASACWSAKRRPNASQGPAPSDSRAAHARS
jgi:hypothetical protein